MGRIIRIGELSVCRALTLCRIAHFRLRPSVRKRMPRRPIEGFTLIELMIVITIIMILVGIAAGMYQRSVIRARESALHHDLWVMREAIDQYTLDRQAAPQSLEDLATGENKYLHEIPTDPITHQKDWRVEYGDFMLSPEQNNPGITDVHSNSDQVSPFENTPYSSW